jgi:hypothetical protein
MPTAQWLRPDRLRAAGLATASLLAASAVFFRVPALASHRTAAELFCWLLAAGLLAAFLTGYRALRATPGRARTVVAFAVAFALLCLLIPPFHDIDLCCYVNIGWQQSHYGLNPYTRTLSEVPGWEHDPMFRPYWQFTPSAYGFLFDLLARFLCGAGAGNYEATLFLFRAVNVIAFALTGAAVWGCCRRLDLPHPERALYLLLWNPLLLMTGLVHGHNDILMAMFTALAVHCALGRGWPLVMPLLAAATLVKYLTGPILPLAFLLLARRHGWGKATVSGALALLLVAAVSWPYLGDGRDFQVAGSVANFTEMHNSLTAMLLFPFELGGKLVPSLAALHPQVSGGIRLAGGAVFAAMYGGVAVRWFRDRDLDAAALVRDCVLIQFVLVCLVSSKFYPWYIGMFLPLAVLLPAGDWLGRAVQAVSCAQVLSLTFINQAHFLNVLVMLLLPLALVLLPPQPARRAAGLVPAG